MSYETKSQTVQMAHANMVDITNEADEHGRPAGGHACAMGLMVKFQDGPLGEAGRQNGCFVEDLLLVAEERLRFYQGGEFACDENARAMEMIRGAHDILNARTEDRRRRKVEGKHQR